MGIKNRYRLPGLNLAIPVLGLLIFAWAGIVFADAGPHGNYGATTDGCAACHRLHTGVQTRLLSIAGSGNAFCFTCHNGMGATAVVPISTHANTDFTDSAEAPFGLECTQCHDPHGNPDTLVSIKRNVLVQDGAAPVIAGPIVFTATVGINSFDDGTSVAASRICVTCHINSDNPGYPMTSHTGGVNHHGSQDYSGQDCTVCHPHSADNDLYTNDGFMPIGNCTGCHSVVQDNGDGIPVGGRRAIISDFTNNSHHVQGTVEDTDCIVCHDLTQHQAGEVRLKNVDTPTTIITLSARPDDDAAAAAALEPFCLACHDSNGAGGTAPFHDGIIPPAVDQTNWNAASHGMTQTCYDCHGNGHGSTKISLLNPWNATPDGSAADSLREEERFCYLCHDGSVAAADVQSVFSLTSHHNVSSLEQGDGSKVECINCHNPHMNNNSSLVSNPDNTLQLWAGSDTDFCLACHDGAPPTSVSFPATFNGTGYNKAAYSNSAHDIGTNFTSGLGARGCLHCHDQHGSVNASLLQDQYRLTHHTSYASTDYNLCWSCHVETRIITDQANFPEHNLHVVQENSPCIHCHDVHNSYDPAEPGLINFVYGVTNLDVSLNGNTPSNFSTSFQIMGNSGQCYLLCHTESGYGSEDHNPEHYMRNNMPVNTVDGTCNACHN